MADEFVAADEPNDPYNPDKVAAFEADRARQHEDQANGAYSLLLRRQEAYQRVFKGSPIGNDLEIVVEDLRSFCRGEMSTFHEDERVHTLLTGRQEVYLRIMDHTRLPLDTLYQRYLKAAGG